MTLLENLNAAQKEAAMYFESPLCILAGAGAGKTRVITYRIANLILDLDVNPRKIMGVTFTNKAASEMRERLESLVPDCFWQVQLGTFHAMAAKYLRRHGDLIGVPADFVIYDQSDSEKLIKQIAKEKFQVEKDEVKPYFQHIDEWQNLGLRPSEVPHSTHYVARQALEVYERYCDALIKNNGLDFNSLIIAWRDLILCPEAENVLKHNIDYLMVDEYQDTNAVQSQIVHGLSRLVKSVAIVGDDDQTIYGWRGASANNLQKFLDELEQTKLIKLEKNYRSTSNILSAANYIIENNQGRIGKTLESTRGTGDSIKIIQALNDLEEAQQIIRMIEADLSKGKSLSDIAILMRTNAQSRLFEEALRRQQINYQLIGGTKFFDRKEVKDVLAILRLALNPSSDLDLLRVLAAKPWGIGSASVKKMQGLASALNLPLFDILSSQQNLVSAKLSKRGIKLALDFAGLILNLKTKLELDPNPFDAIAMAIDASGLVEFYKSKDNDESEARVDNLSQLQESAENFSIFAEKIQSPNTIQAFLEEATLMSKADVRAGENEDSLSLMTLHAAKGLEFDTVYMAGMEERVFPHARAIDNPSDPNELEEERRLAYVGITRAKDKLVLSYAKRRMFQGSVQNRFPSRFLKELPENLVVGDKSVFRDNNYRVDYNAEYTPSTQNSFGKKSWRSEIKKPAVNSPFAPGKMVEHKIFGRGKILGISGSGQFLRANVQFDRDMSRRTIMTQFLNAS